MRNVIATLVAGTALLGVGGSSVAHAQDLGGALDLGQLGRDLSFSASMRAQAERDAARLKGKSRSGRKAIVASSGSTRYKPNLTLRKQNLAKIVEKSRATDPQTAASLEQAFAKDPIAAIAPGLSKYGLRTDDVADATAAYLVSAWYGVRGSNVDPPTAKVRAVRDQIRRAYLATPKFASASNATKQQMSEALLVQTMITDALVTAAKSNPEQMPQVKAAIRQGALNSFGFDLAKIQLTDTGFRI